MEEKRKRQQDPQNKDAGQQTGKKQKNRFRIEASTIIFSFREIFLSSKSRIACSNQLFSGCFHRMSQYCIQKPRFVKKKRSPAGLHGPLPVNRGHKAAEIQGRSGSDPVIFMQGRCHGNAQRVVFSHAGSGDSFYCPWRCFFFWLPCSFFLLAHSLFRPSGRCFAHLHPGRAVPGRALLAMVADFFRKQPLVESVYADKKGAPGELLIRLRSGPGQPISWRLCAVFYTAQRLAGHIPGGQGGCLSRAHAASSWRNALWSSVRVADRSRPGAGLRRKLFPGRGASGSAVAGGRKTAAKPETGPGGHCPRRCRGAQSLPVAFPRPALSAHLCRFAGSGGLPLLCRAGPQAGIRAHPARAHGAA